MTRAGTYLVCLLAIPFIAMAQLRVNKPNKSQSKASNFGFGLGAAKSVLYLTRNVNNNNDAKGIAACVTYDKGNYLRGSFEYNYYGSIDISPTWYDVRAQTFEFNMSVLSKSKEHTFFFYPIAGVSYNIFKGFFTGINDYLNLASLYNKNRVVRTDWIGFNAGLGVDINFKGGAIYINYKMRVGRTEGFNQINIMDVYTAAGMKFYIKSSSINKFFRGPRSRYSLSRKAPSK